MTLYEITKDFQDLLELMNDPDVPPEVIADTMEGIEGAFEVKADNYITLIKSLETDNYGDKEEIERLNARVKRRSDNIARMKERLMNAMNLTGKKKLPTEHYVLSIAKNGGLAPLVVTGNVPADYCRMEPDNSKIRAALDQGELDFAHLGERGTHLAIR